MKVFPSIMRLYCIRCDLADRGSWFDGQRLEQEGLHLLNLMDTDIETYLRDLSRCRKRA
jgi:hypothetical protein